MDRQIETAGGHSRAVKRLNAVGPGYMAFAARYPEHFRIMDKGKFKLDGRAGQKVNAAASAVSRRLTDALRDAYAQAKDKELTPEQLRVRAALPKVCVHGDAAQGLGGVWPPPEAPQGAALV